MILRRWWDYWFKVEPLDVSSLTDKLTAAQPMAGPTSLMFGFDFVTAKDFKRKPGTRIHDFIHGWGTVQEDGVAVVFDHPVALAPEPETPGKLSFETWCFPAFASSRFQRLVSRCKRAPARLWRKCGGWLKRRVWR